MRKFLILLVLFAMTDRAKATHIVGGNLYVTWISGNTYRVTLTIWRDCSGIQLDDSCMMGNTIQTSTGSKPFTDTRYIGKYADIILGVFDRVTNQKVDSIYMHLKSKKILSLGDSCFKPTNICVEEGVYHTTIDLANNPNGLYISWQRCCRNSVILNATDPGNNGPGYAAMVFYASIPNPGDPAIRNSTPEFGSYPQAYMCANTLNTINDFKATDRDGDQLVYSLITPLNGFAQSNQAPVNGLVGQLWGNGGCTVASPVTTKGPYPTLNWVSPYSLSNIVGGTPAMAINTTTGVITASPVTLGIFVFAVKVEEYRNSVKIGEIVREVQYQVIPCTGNAPPSFSKPVAGTSISYTITAGDTLCFPITLNDPDANDSITVTAAGDLLNNPNFASVTFTPVYNHKTGTTQLCAISTCESISETPYNVRLTGKDFSCYGSNTVNLDVKVYVKPNIDGKIPYVPNVFTPNGDNRNDYFKLNATADYCANDFSVIIFNRWGVKVFESNELGFKWDGKFMKNGKDLPDGVYYYLITATFRTSTFEDHGFVHLLR